MKLKRIEIENFNRWKSFAMDFSDVEKIQAPTGMGKTSIYQAFLYAMGLDVKGFTPKNDYEPLDVETKVKIVIDVDGLEHVFERTSKPTYICDGVKEKKKENYIANICGLVGINQNDLEMVCNTNLFNLDTNKWGWKERFNTLNKYLQFSTITTPLATRPEYNAIAKYIQLGKTPIEIESALRIEKKNLETELATTNALITDKEKALIGTCRPIEEIDNEIKQKNAEINELQIKLAEIKSKSPITILKEELEKVENERVLLVSKLDSKQAKNNATIQQINAEISQKQAEIKRLDKELEEYKEHLENLENDAVFCLYCGSPLTEEKKEEQEITLKSSIQNTLDKLDVLVCELKKLQDKLSLIPTAYDCAEIIMLDNKRDRIKKQIETTTDTIDTAEIELDLDYTESLLQDLYMEKSNYFVLTKTKQELETLKSKRAEISQQVLGNATGKEQLTIYFKEVQEIYNQAVKQVFGKEISFKFFSVKQNGDYNQECVVKRTIRDLPTTYYEMSFGERVKTDILTTLGFQKLLNVNLPIWADNINGLTDDLPKTENQIIYLETSKENNILDKGVQL